VKTNSLEGRVSPVPGAGDVNGDKIGDPLFVDFKNRDLRLRAGSPAVDAGIDLGYKLDFDGNPIPSGSAPDMGAYERQFLQ